MAAELADREVLALGWRGPGGRLVAGVRARTSADEPGVVEIGRLSVAPDQQGQGLGTRLLAAVEDRLPPSVATLRLFTGEHSVGNLRLYARLGYQETRRQLISAGYELVHFSKDCGHRNAAGAELDL